ncbi:MAG: class I tRNA ligase family protein, partial [Verrucomicrobiota bacterium]|nr:class I tRNA ligase family protein [Verrucomicrobiota bacterium]
DMGLLIEREPYENTVGFSERGNVPIEPRLSEQWFLKYPKVKEAKRAVENGTIKFHPDRWKKTYLHWLNGIQDWCISRQLWWGHRIPVWYKKGIQRNCIDFNNPEHVHVSVDGPADSENWEQEEDVLDTWASSYLWPMANLGWPNPTNAQQKELDFWYPTSTLVTGFDIIFFWVARMIIAGLELFGDDTQDLSDEEIVKRVPFKNVFIHGLIRDDKGRKMSKSLGNSPDPLDLIEKYGADGLRFGICNITPSGSDILFSQERIQIGRNFCNKLWNAARFRQMSGPMSDNSSFEAIICRIHTDLFDDYDHWIISRLEQVTSDLEKCFRHYEIAPLTHLIYSFFWGDFCDWYLEASKGKLRGDECLRNNCLGIQDLVIRQVLQLSNPIIPHITEELWHGLGYDEVIPYIQSTPIILARTIEERVPVDSDAIERAMQLQELITQARSLKAQYNLAAKRDVAIFYSSEEIAARVIEENSSLIQTLVGLGSLDVVGHRSVDGLPAAVTPLGSIYLDLSRSLDVDSEKARLRKEVEKLNKLISANEGKLRNPKFVESAPEKVVEGTRKQLSEIIKKRDDTQRILESM